jgi:hypothetical protein
VRGYEMIVIKVPIVHAGEHTTAVGARESRLRAHRHSR